jgi:hypothetical protein
MGKIQEDIDDCLKILSMKNLCSEL